MNYLVTGAAGFIGSACAAFLIRGGRHVRQSIIFQQAVSKEYHKGANLLEEMFLILV